MALSTRRRVPVETTSGLLRTRDTVAVDTSARAATSWMVVMDLCDRMGASTAVYPVRM